MTLDALSADLILKEIIGRLSARFKIEDFCFEEQLEFINDESQFKTAVCSRRAGKTIACAADLIATAIKVPNIVCLYITLSRVNASRIIWPELKKINTYFKLGGTTNETELSIKFANGSVIYCSGAKDKSEIENFRGLALKKVYIDECFHPDTLIDTPKGKAKIKDLKIGDEILNCYGRDIITDITRKKVTKTVELTYNGKTITCSDNHPFFTKRGWVNAGMLTVQDELCSTQHSMHILWDQKVNGKIWESEEASFLFNQLRSEVKECGDKQKNVSIKPNEKQRDKGKSVIKTQGDWTQAECKTRKWSWSNSTRVNDNRATSRHKVELHGWVRTSKVCVSKKLQVRSSLSRFKTWCRDRWKISLPTVQTSTRQKENRSAGFFRLDNIKIQEQRSTTESEDCYFYDLTVKNHPSYSVNGALVHNCQSFRAYIQELIDDVISKALFDYAGTLCLIGTPGLIPSGYFYDVTHSEEWKHFAWTMFENPHLQRKSGKTVMELVLADCKRMGVTIDHPKIQRECFGKWVVDTDSLIFKYSAEINDYKELPIHKTGEWQYVIGVDIGHDDADAICVIGWHEYDKVAYLIKEVINRKQGITELADQIEGLINEFDPIRVVMDTGGLGKKIAEEIRRRRSLPIQAAEKSRKMEFIELLNDAMRTGRFKAKKESAFAQDCFLVERDDDKTTADKIVISDRYHTDIGEAVLYGFREALHWLSEPEVKPLKPKTPEWIEREEQRLEDALEEQMRQEKQDDGWDSLGLN